LGFESNPSLRIGRLAAQQECCAGEGGFGHRPDGRGDVGNARVCNLVRHTQQLRRGAEPGYDFRKITREQVSADLDLRLRLGAQWARCRMRRCDLRPRDDADLATRIVPVECRRVIQPHAEQRGERGFGGGTDADLRLGWQEFLLRVIANAFDLPPMLLGIEHDVNRSTASELGDQAFRAAIVPTARLFAEQLTRGAIEKKLGWGDLEFVFTDVDSRNEMEEAQIQEILLRNGVLTVNEARQMRGLPPL